MDKKNNGIADKETLKLRRAALVTNMVTAFVMPFMGNSLNLAIPDIGAEFGANASAVGWMVTAYILTVAALSVPFGRLADVTSRKAVMVTGMIIFIVFCAVSVLASSMSILIAFRIAQAIGASMVLSSNMPILISAYPGNMRGRVLGLSTAAVYTGLALGPVLGGFLTYTFGWRSIFLFVSVVLVVPLVVMLAFITDRKDRGKSSYTDISGTILFMIFIIAFMFGMSFIGRGITYVIIAGIGMITGILFIVHELKDPNPVLNISLFRSNIGYTMSNISALLNYSATFAIGYLISLYLQIVMGYSAATAGLVMITQPAVMALLTPTMGRLSDRFSPFIMSSLGMLLCAVGTTLFIFVRVDTSLTYVITALIVTGLGFSLFASPNTNAVMGCVDRKDYGIANSVLNTMRSVGQTLSMVIVTIIVSATLPGIQLVAAEPSGLVGVIRTAFIIFTIMCIAGVFLSLKRKRNY
ncbi:MAG: MFS transporter [Lentihominibacter sp.]